MPQLFIILIHFIDFMILRVSLVNNCETGQETFRSQNFFFLIDFPLFLEHVAATLVCVST